MITLYSHTIEQQTIDNMEGHAFLIRSEVYDAQSMMLAVRFKLVHFCPSLFAG